MMLDVRQVVSDSYKIFFNSQILLALALIGSLLDFGFSFVTVGSSQQLSANISKAMSAPGYISPSAFAVLVEPSVILQVLSAVVSALISGLIISLVYFKGDSLSDVLQNARESYFTLLAALLLLGIPSFLIVLFFFLPKLVLGYVNFEFLIISLLLIIPVEYVIYRLIVTAVEIVVVRRSVIESLKVSWKLTKGNVWGIFFIILLITLAANILGAVFSFVNSFAGDLVSYFFYYPAVIAPVLIYKQLSNPQSEGAVSFVAKKK